MKRLQNRIAESRYALPLTALYAIGVWQLAGLTDQRLYVQLATLAVSTYLMVELNNSNALIRIYSRMVSCAFLMLTAMVPFLFRSFPCELLMLCIITFYTIILQTYQDKHSPGLTFYAFLCLGIASVVYVKVLYFVPFIWILMASRLQAFSGRMLVASLLGLIAPWWFIVTWCFFNGDWTWLATHFEQLYTFEPPFGNLRSVADGVWPVAFSQQPATGLQLLISIAFVLLLSLIGTVHYLRNNSRDKIRTQMIFEMIIILQLLTTAFAIVQPSQASMLLTILIINASVLAGHFIALTNTRLTNILFCLLVATCLLITAYNLWTPSLPF